MIPGLNVSEIRRLELFGTALVFPVVLTLKVEEEITLKTPFVVSNGPRSLNMESVPNDNLPLHAMPTTGPVSAIKRLKVLLVDDDETDRFLARRSLGAQDCEVVEAQCVTDALKQIAEQRFDVLITDLHMPDAGDGFAVVTAMRHSQPDALTLVVSDFPDVQKALNAVLLQADEVLVKPFDGKRLAGLMDQRKLSALPSPRTAKEGVASILDRDAAILMASWLERVEEIAELVALPVSTEERVRYLPEMIRSITARLRGNRGLEVADCATPAAVAHGQCRYRQGYTAPMIVQESRLLQVSIFETIQRNLSTVDFASVLPDIMIIADEVDCQLRQTISSFLTLHDDHLLSSGKQSVN
jgi:CheY-like chemotaxis protein